MDAPFSPSSPSSMNTAPQPVLVQEHAASPSPLRTWGIVIAAAITLGVIGGVLSKYGSPADGFNQALFEGVGLKATCVTLPAGPQIKLSWNVIAEATEQSLLKTGPTGILVELKKDSTSPLSLHEYVDKDVRFGEGYSYSLFIGKPGTSPEVTLIATPQKCPIAK